MIRYNLQFFAKEGMGGEKTEPATQKKLSDARKKGQVAKSRELTNGLELLALFLILKFWVGHMGIQFLDVFNNIYSKIPDVTMYWQDTMPEREASILFSQLLLGVLMIIAPILLIGYLIAFITDVAQVKWRPSLEPMKPKFNKLNPISGFKKIFSVNALVELVKSIAKIALIGYVCYSYLKDKWPILFNLYDVTLMQALELVAGIVTDLGIRVAVFYMVLAFADYAYQKFKFSNDMKMTKQEVKEEFKQQEGDPQVKGKIRQKMRETSMKRMMQSLPQADVVITNPTHYAVAIKYDPQVADAPLVIAKGEDYLAARIKEAAKENNIEIVENKPLARMLYANVDIGQAVPPELYQAVAEVLAFVYQLQGRIYDSHLCAGGVHDVHRAASGGHTGCVHGIEYCYRFYGSVCLHVHQGSAGYVVLPYHSFVHHHFPDSNERVLHEIDPEDGHLRKCGNDLRTVRRRRRPDYRRDRLHHTDHDSVPGHQQRFRARG